MRCHNNRSTIFHNNKYITVGSLTQITQAVWSQKTVIDYNEVPANPGPQSTLYTSCQCSSPLPANLVVACRALSATPLLLSKPLPMPGPGSVWAGVPLPIHPYSCRPWPGSAPTPYHSYVWAPSRSHQRGHPVTITIYNNSKRTTTSISAIANYYYYKYINIPVSPLLKPPSVSTFYPPLIAHTVSQILSS